MASPPTGFRFKARRVSVPGVLAGAIDLLFGSSAVLLNLGGGGGNTINATSASQADVETAIASASTGDTVVVPASGSVQNWTSGFTLSKAITLQGPGAANLTVNLTGATITKQAAGPIRVKGFTFQNNTTSPNLIYGSIATELLIIEDCTLIGSDVMFRPECNGVLVANCTIYCNNPPGEAMFQIKNPGGLSDYQSNPTYGMLDSTGKRNFYIEDCLIYGAGAGGQNSGGPLTDADDAARVVIRYNIFNESQVNSHGYATSAVGVRHFEVYENEFRYRDANVNLANGHIWFRGGSGLIYNNSFEDITGQDWGDKVEINFSIRSVDETLQPCGFPHIRQLGRGWDEALGQEVDENIYFYGNTGAPAVDVKRWAPEGCTSDLWTDYIAPIWKTTTKPGYTAYTYPHPLRETTGTAY